MLWLRRVVVGILEVLLLMMRRSILEIIVSVVSSVVRLPDCEVMCCVLVSVIAG